MRAARFGRSAEAEAREILTEATLPEAGQRSAEALQEWVRGLYGGRLPGNVAEDLISERRREASRE